MTHAHLMKPNDVIVTLVTSDDVTVPPDGRHLDVGVGRIGSTSIRWGSWDPKGSWQTIGFHFQPRIQKRPRNLDPLNRDFFSEDD